MASCNRWNKTIDNECVSCVDFYISNQRLSNSLKILTNRMPNDITTKENNLLTEEHLQWLKDYLKIAQRHGALYFLYRNCEQYIYIMFSCKNDKIGYSTLSFCSFHLWLVCFVPPQCHNLQSLLLVIGTPVV